ncbi:MAG: hypothetical protein ABI948_10665 [Thermoleophilia bacterium]
MELHEVARRIVGQHWRLILVLLLLGAGLGAVHSVGARTYTASTRLVLDTQDPKTRAESIAIADTAGAIATSPAQVEGALRDAHVAGRDSVKLAKNHVSLRGLGTSAVLELSVNDRNPRVARAVSNALAGRLIRTRQDLSSGEIEQALTRLDRQIESTNRRIAAADAASDYLNVQAATGNSSNGSGDLRAKRDAAARLRDFLAQQRGVLESERVSLLSTNALRPKPRIISPATLPRHPEPSQLVPDLILGGLLGVLLGVGLAGLLETMRPTLVGSYALAREFDTPLLGTLPSNPDEDDPRQDVAGIAVLLRLAAEAAHVDHVGLAGTVPDLDLRRFAERLEEGQAAGLDIVPAEANDVRLAGTAGAPGPGTGELPPDWSPSGPPSDSGRSSADRGGSGLRIRSFSLQSASSNNGTSDGIVLVSPSTVMRAELVGVSNLLRLTPVPLLGLIVYKVSRSPGHGHGRRPSGAVVGAGSGSTLAS